MNHQTLARLRREQRARELLGLMYTNHMTIENLSTEKHLHQLSRPDTGLDFPKWVNRTNLLQAQMTVAEYTQRDCRLEWDQLPARNRITAIRLFNRVSRWYNPDHQPRYQV